ncbi:hypothetical protein M2103_000588 [Ereboglobus sp. PH5-5]|uniref:hypothetical protein n=1 Tax=unclassified Ereboglobus TaxID=2626932 RepID=UPI00240750F3|nr:MULTISPECIES: hypothetical protein [unclassified Ereboglobus]MDF9827978.1 hypothetical protein [Ereboglobus sp. PH5-10]MDF9832378.1 hypothetical protein [Ereboglobus sp. PH5-5]
MKSAYELAMERLAQSEPSTAPLSDGQKKRLAEIDKVYAGKIAEREIFLKQSLASAQAGQNYEEIEKIQTQLAAERVRLEEEREAEKDRVRRS